MKDIHEEIEEIASLIKNREAYEKLNKLERQMENDNDVLVLSNIFMMTQREYSDALKHYDENSNEIKPYLQKMHEAKYNLDIHPLVVEYYKCLKEVNEPLRYLEFNLLSKFKEKMGSCK